MGREDVIEINSQVSNSFDQGGKKWHQEYKYGDWFM